MPDMMNSRCRDVKSLRDDVNGCLSRRLHAEARVSTRSFSRCLYFQVEATHDILARDASCSRNKVPNSQGGTLATTRRYTNNLKVVASVTTIFCPAAVSSRTHKSHHVIEFKQRQGTRAGMVK